MNYTIEKVDERREFLTFLKPNAKGERIQMDIVKCMDSNFKNSLPKLWKKTGCVNKILPSYWSIRTFVTDKNGTQERYNPQNGLSDDGKYPVLNFGWILEATPQNKEKLIAEVERLAFPELYICD